MMSGSWKTFRDAAVVTLAVVVALFGTVHLINQVEMSYLEKQQAEFAKNLPPPLFYPCDGGNPSRADVQVPQPKC